MPELIAIAALLRVKLRRAGVCAICGFELDMGDIE